MYSEVFIYLYFSLHACLSPLTFNGPLQCFTSTKPIYIQTFCFTDHPLLGRLYHDILVFFCYWLIIPFPCFSCVSEKKSNLLCPGKNGHHSFRETWFGIVVLLVQFYCPDIEKFGFSIVPCEYITRHKGHPLGFQCVLNNVCCIKVCNADLCDEVQFVSRHCICSRS